MTVPTGAVTGVMAARGLLANPAMFTGAESTTLECLQDWVSSSTLHNVTALAIVPLLSNRQHLSSGVCREDNREDNYNCSVLCCVRQLCTVIRTRV